MNRRSLTAALSTPEQAAQALEFVKGPQNPPPLPQPLDLKPKATVEVASSPKRALPKSVEAPSDGATVSITVRVPCEVPRGLLLASADRKLKRQRPWTQQEIVAEALVGWLKNHGFMDTK